MPLIVKLKKAEIVLKSIFVVPDKEACEFIRNIVVYDTIISLVGKLACVDKYKKRFIRAMNKHFGRT